jgi:hypothetical protein
MKDKEKRENEKTIIKPAALYLGADMHIIFHAE